MRSPLPRVTMAAAQNRPTEMEITPEAVSKHLQTQEARPSTLSVLKLAYQSLGVIYGDMGTSPLYVFSSTFVDPPHSKADVIGAVSLIFWTITVIGLIKYVIIVLSADDNGEGGTAALYTLLCRHVKISLLISQHKSDKKLTNYKRKKNQSHSRLKTFLERSPKLHVVLLVVVMAGSCMVIGDGILTPAISVLSAVEGIQVVATSLKQNMVVLITCVILIGLFLLQRSGTARVGFLFAPIVLLWFGLIGGIGIYNIAVHKPSIFQACAPHHAVTFLIRNKKNGWIMLGGVVLSITDINQWSQLSIEDLVLTFFTTIVQAAGTEAMFADLGHFSQRSIQIAFAGVVYPCLVLAYFGQAAYLTIHPEDVADTFFKSVPKPMFWPMLVVATLATVVASQAMISGAFSVINQSVNLGCFPTVKVIYTSPTVQGQIYIPEVNYTLMVLCIAVVVGFRKTTAIGNAYGIAVVSVMSITTCLVALVIIIVWQQHAVVGIAFLCFFGSIEAVYLSSVLYKVASGGWVPLVFAALILSIMCIWQYGTLKKHKFDLQHMVHIDHLDELISDSRITRVPGIGLFYSETDSGIPPTFSHFISNIPAIHQVMIFVCIKHVPVTSVLPNERFFMKPLAVKNFFQCVIRYGYNETPCAGEDFDDHLVRKIAELIRADRFWQASAFSKASSRETLSPTTESRVSSSTPELIHLAKVSSMPPLPPLARTYIQLSTADPNTITIKPEDEVVKHELAYLYGAKEKGMVYVVGYTDVQAKPGSSWYKRFVIDIAYCMLRKNCRSNVVMLNIPTTRLIEVGMIYDI